MSLITKPSITHRHEGPEVGKSIMAVAGHLLWLLSGWNYVEDVITSLESASDAGSMHSAKL